MIYSKTLYLDDYDELPVLFIDTLLSEFKDIARFEHKHRKWEYGMALEALKKRGCKRILEIGGGESLFLPLVVRSGIDIVEIDPYDCSEILKRQSSVLKKDIEYIQEDFLDTQLDEQFDAVVAISVIEHVKLDIMFFDKMIECVKPGGLLILTTDFHPSGNTFSKNHRRTYNEMDLNGLIKRAEKKDLVPFGDVDYTYTDNFVYQYTFASLVLERKYE